MSDAAWLAQLCEVGLLTGSFVPPPEIARLRDLTRYRKKLINERGRETQRVQKLLEATGIKSTTSPRTSSASRRVRCWKR